MTDFTKGTISNKFLHEDLIKPSFLTDKFKKTLVESSPPLGATLFGLFFVLSMVLGLVLLFGGPERLSAPVYHSLLVTGGPKLWGAGLVSLGITLWLSDKVKPHRGVVRWTLLLLSMVYFSLSSMFVVQALHDPTVTLTAPVMYAWVGMAHVVVSEKVRGGVVWVSRHG